MGFIQTIINFLKQLFGGGAEPGLPASTSAAASPSMGAAAASADDQDDDDDDPSKAAREEMEELQQLIQRFEASGEDTAGVDWQQPETWWKKQFGHEEMQAAGQDPDEALRELGFRDQDHFYLVRDYVAAKWSRLGKNDDGEDEVTLDDQFQNAAMSARSGQMQQMQQAAMNADPSLLVPVEGVSVETWATAAAEMMQLGGGATVGEVNELLAKHGLTREQYDKAQAGWQAKMQGDTTGVIATKYGEAFQRVQQGAAAAAGGPGANGGEPCSFERFIEVMVAQGCWAEQGLDVSAQLKQTFGIDVGEYSRWGAYWSPKMGMDVALSRQYDSLEKRYKAKYAGAGMDDDLSL